ncbi:hypothetical protein EJ063_00800 [Vibrio aquaticus]|uniref:Uncharacterized protein n=1 Tax=Vibrio aquaticus TaxID=2496559 RepID=A0A432D0B2_9VIBR|nr:hypothetical protein [Vibrio aquaticus]RTZ17351.1 hypothetical protein EJ063_00800 [Vibrio aquaticus]
MCSPEKLEQLVYLLQNENTVVTDDGFFELFIDVTAEVKSLLTCLDDESVPFDVNGSYFKADQLLEGQTCKVELDPSQLMRAGYEIYLKWEDFFSYPKNLTQAPVCFYVHSSKSVYLGDSENISEPTLKCYLDVLKLINCLKKASDHSEDSSSDKKTFIFLHKARMNIECDYSLKDIEHGIDGITQVDTWFGQKTHKDQRKAIFKAALYDQLKSVDSNKRFQHLIANFGDISAKLVEDYNLYVSEFSFDDVRLEYQEKKREFIVKINDTFNDIQTKALGIPVSIGLVAFRLSSQNIDANAKNLAADFLLYAAAMIYGLMMFLLVCNQLHTLKSLKKEYRDQEARLKRKYPKQHGAIRGEFKELDRRHRFQKFQLCFFLFLVGVLVYLVDHYIHFDLWNYLVDTFPAFKTIAEFLELSVSHG